MADTPIQVLQLYVAKLEADAQRMIHLIRGAESDLARLAAERESTLRMIDQTKATLVAISAMPAGSVPLKKVPKMRKRAGPTSRVTL